ncbi:MAG TPA: DUF6786 family protein [Pirellulales bacterium]|jgi:hypothetical protein|nr:DUF6786 family protein [Pirellulales bacterium]
MHTTILSLALLLSAVVAGTGVASAQQLASSAPKTFAEDLQFLDSHGKKPIVLSDGDAVVAVLPALQGRIMTSTSGGNGGPSFGWINRELIASGEVAKHINAFGGEDRLWLGPEGGQFSIFFAPKTKFDLEHWFTPAPFDTEAFDLVSQTGNRVVLRKDFHLTNYSGTKFDVRIDRDLLLLPAADVWKDLGVDAVAGLKIVGFESINRLTNAGQKPWKKGTGLLSLWSMGMFNASPAATILVPIKAGSDAELGTPVTSDYFGQVPPDRLKLQDNVVYFKADAKYRSKIGISPRRAKPTFGSYDAANHVLTLIQYSLPSDDTDYVNSAWKIQEHPYAGDVVNSYNDGPPPSGGKQLGHFYELETSSPAAELVPGHFIDHLHRTIHLQGDPAELEKVSLATLGVHLNEIPFAGTH